MALSPRQRRFVSEYVKDQHGKRAAIRAGYSPKTAKQIAGRIHNYPEVKAAIEAKLTKVEEKALVDAAFVLGGLKNVAVRCQQGEPVMEFNHDTKEMEKTGEWKFDSSGANRSLELLGKHLNLFKETVTHELGSSVMRLLAQEANEGRNATPSGAAA